MQFLAPILQSVIAQHPPPKDGEPLPPPRRTTRTTPSTPPTHTRATPVPATATTSPTPSTPTTTPTGTSRKSSPTPRHTPADQAYTNSACTPQQPRLRCRHRPHSVVCIMKPQVTGLGCVTTRVLTAVGSRRPRRTSPDRSGPDTTPGTTGRPPIAVSGSRRTYRLCTRVDQVPQAGHAARSADAPARTTTNPSSATTPSVTTASPGGTTVPGGADHPRPFMIALVVTLCGSGAESDPKPRFSDRRQVRAITRAWASHAVDAAPLSDQLELESVTTGRPRPPRG
ncbi:hypothetical protein SHXM_00240 [Streptomyces hygroscopicus]|nr:hypothetical protein SHXM_00240 [Streptomyces hygroscopicus]